MRIGIVGGGAAGLSAAYFLQQRGYHDVTVLECKPNIGGMCDSFDYEERSYDLGGDFITPTYVDVLKIADEFGAKTHPVPGRHSLDVKASRYSSTLCSMMRGSVHWSLPSRVNC